MVNYTDKSVYGVAVAVFCPPTERFLLLTEKYDKPAVCKSAGMHTFVCETSKPSDTSVRATVRRAVSEEVGMERVANEDIFIREQPLDHLAHGVRVFVGWVVVEHEFTPELTEDEDVYFHAWLTAGEIRAYAHKPGKLRIETMPTLEIVLRGRGGVDV